MIGLMHSRITIARRFCGPADSGNGGYTAGSLARYVGGAAEVTLRRPPPLERALTVEVAGDRATLLDDDGLVAEAVAVRPEIDAPPPVDLATATAAAQRAPTRLRPEIHPFPMCFACGPDRVEPDGLRLFAGPVSGSDLCATPWVPAENADEIVWAALDCPSAAPMYFEGDDQPTFVLGRITAEIAVRPAIGVDHVIMSWKVSRAGRKLQTGSAIYAPDGTRCAVAAATWIQLAES